MFTVQAGNDLGSGLIKFIGPVSNMHQDKYTPHISHKIAAESYLFTSILGEDRLCSTVKTLWIGRAHCVIL